jgi:16S rRNA C967 or C1407 C5-methylase (RsmB/RsmF family)
MNELEMKVQAFKERLAELTVTYEDRIADLRIEITRVVNENNELKQHNANLQDAVSVQPAEVVNPIPEVVQGSVQKDPSPKA